MNLPSTAERVPAHSAETVNREIALVTKCRFQHFASHPEGIENRLHELDEERHGLRALRGDFNGLNADAGRQVFDSGPACRAAGNLEPRTALITGGDSGIGHSVAILLAREGADVAIVHLPEEREDARNTAEMVQAQGRRFLALEGDVRDAAFCQFAVDQTVNKLGRLDVLVNNTAFQNHVEIDDLSLEQWEKTFHTNIFGYFHMVKAVLPHLKEGAVIINSGSITRLDGNGKLIDYASTKGAIHAFTKSLVQALFSRGRPRNGVSPGSVWKPLKPAQRSDEPERFQQFPRFDRFNGSSVSTASTETDHGKEWYATQALPPKT